MAGNFSKPRSFLDKIKAIFTGGDLKQHLEAVEETLIEADLDLKIVSEFMEKLKGKKINSYEDAAFFLKKEFIAGLKDSSASNSKENKKPYIIILTGINGGGKTTTASKIAGLYKAQNKKILLVAADTFRAAAIEQLEKWAQKLDIDILKGAENADPASVVYDAVIRAKKDNYDVVIIDTAGRLHTKINLMEELAKMKRVIGKEIAEENIDTFIIIDSNIGKNAYAQTKEFNTAMKVTGVVLTKFDSTSKGGSIIKIKSEMNIPIKFITFGEQIKDIDYFRPEDFVNKLFN